MSKLILFLFAIVEGHYLFDHWARRNKLDPEFLHKEAMEGVARAEGVMFRFKHHNLVSAANRTFNLNKEIANLQRIAIGFVDGASIDTSSKICKSALVNGFDSIVDVIDNRWVWIPDYTVKFNAATNKLTSYFNTAYAYCGLDQIYYTISTLFSTTSAEAMGRLVTRILTSLTVSGQKSLWTNLNCMMDSMLGENYKDLGVCMGRVYLIFLDTPLG